LNSFARALFKFAKSFFFPYPFSFPNLAQQPNSSNRSPARVQPVVAQLLSTVAAAQHGLSAHFRRQPVFPASALGR
jgi:hypothetical protein